MTNRADDASADALRRVIDGAVQRQYRLIDINQQFSQAEQAWRATAAQQMQAAAAESEAAGRRTQAAIRERAAATAAAAAGVARREASVLAPDALSWPWDAAEWADVRPGHAPKSVSWIRIGTIDTGAPGVPGPGVPALAPLLNHAGWVVRGSATDFSDFVQGVLLRVFCTVPLHRIEVVVFDPSLEMQLGAFAPLREVAARSMAPAIAHVDDLEEALEGLIDGVVATSEELSGQGMANIEEHWRSVGSLDLVYRLVIINAYPQAITAKAQESLVRLARARGTRGVSLIVRHDRAVPPERDIDPKELIALLSPIDVSGAVVSAACLPETRVASDGRPSRSGVQVAVASAAGSSAMEAIPTISIRELVEAIQDPWADAEFDGIHAAFGRIGRRPLELRLMNADPALPNALIGGATGQGKSNLILAIIHSLAARYRPDELRMYILDFRQGVEMSSLGPSEGNPTWLPHAEVLGLESDRSFGLSVLRHLVEQLTVRSDVLTAAGAKGIVDYRRDHGGRMSRLLLIVDEFQMLLDGDDEISRESVALLEQLARQGRGYGIHLILASQTISGIRGLATKGDAIFGQFPNRLSLKNTAAESQAILGQRNTAAAELAYRGEIIANEDFGEVSHNRRGVVALANEGYLRELRRTLWERSAPHATRPLVFFGARPAAWDEDTIEGMAAARSAALGAGYRLWIGRPVAVDPTPLDVRLQREADQAVLVLGTGEAEAAGVISSMLASLAMTSSTPTRWIVLDGLASGEDASDSSDVPTWLAGAMDLGIAAGHHVRHVGRAGIRRFLLDECPDLLSQRSTHDPDTFVIVLAPQRVPGMADVEMLPSGSFAAAADSLKSLLLQGSAQGVFTIGWWLNKRTAESHLGFGTPGVGAHVLCGLGRDEVQGILGPLEPVPQGHPRVMIKDPRSIPQVRTAIPFSPLTAESAARLEGSL